MGLLLSAVAKRNLLSDQLNHIVPGAVQSVMEACLCGSKQLVTNFLHVALTLVGVVLQMIANVSKPVHILLYHVNTLVSNLFGAVHNKWVF